MEQGNGIFNITPGTCGIVLLGSVEGNELASLPHLPFVLLLVCAGLGGCATGWQIGGRTLFI